jgi:hypothetical protein
MKAMNIPIIGDRVRQSLLPTTDESDFDEIARDIEIARNYYYNMWSPSDYALTI